MSSSRPSRVLYVLNSASSGGANRSLAALLSRLDRARFEPHAVVPKTGPMIARLDDLGIPVQVLPLPGTMRLQASAAGKMKAAARNGLHLLRLARRLRRERFRLVHTNTIFPLGGAIAARLAAVPHVWHVREGLDAPVYRTRLGRENTLKMMAALSAHLICISDYVARVSVAPAARARASVVYNPVELPPGPPLRRSAGPCTVGCIGLISRQKRTDRFVEAAALIAEALPGTRFVVAGRPGAGEEPLMETCRRRAEALGLGGQLEFPGFVSNPSDLYRDLDLLIHPAVFEGFGRVVVEAMAHGIPVVGTNSGAVPEIIRDGETGRVVPPDSVAALAAAAIEILRDAELYRRLSQAARDDVAQRFTVSAHVEAVVDIYRQLIEAPFASAAVSGGTRGS